MKNRDIEIINPRLTECRYGFSKKDLKIQPLICFNCNTNQDLTKCSKCNKIFCKGCLEKRMCKNCYQNSRGITNLFFSGSKKIYP